MVCVRVTVKTFPKNQPASQLELQPGGIWLSSDYDVWRAVIQIYNLVKGFNGKIMMFGDEVVLLHAERECPSTTMVLASRYIFYA